MKHKIRLAQLLACLAIALAGVLAFAAPARATVPYIDENGAAFNCRRVYFDDDGMTWSRFCYRYNGQEFEYNSFWDDESGLVPTGEDFYIVLGYHASTVELTAQSGITIADGTEREFIGTTSDGAYVYRIPAGTADVTVTTRGSMMGTFDELGVYTPDQNVYPGYPSAYPINIQADEGFSGFSDFLTESEYGFPIHVKNADGTTTLYMWDGEWASFGIGVKDGYDINDCYFGDYLEMTWSGGATLKMQASGGGYLRIITSDAGINRWGENCIVTAEKSEQLSQMLFGIKFDMNEPDFYKQQEIQAAAADQISEIADSWNYKAYEPALGTIFGKCAFDPQSIHIDESVASQTIAVAVIPPEGETDDSSIFLVNKESGVATLVDGARAVSVFDTKLIRFEITIGDLLSSYVLAISPFEVDWDYVDTDQQTGISVNLSSIDAQKVSDASLVVSQVTKSDDLTKAKNAIKESLETGDSFSPDEAVAYNVWYIDSEGYQVLGGLVGIGALDYPAYVTIPVPAGWDASVTRVYQYFEESWGSESHIEAIKCEAELVDGGAALKFTPHFCLGRFVLVCEGGSETHAPGWDQTPSGAWVYYKDDGTLLTNDWVEYAGKMYYFDSDGFLVWNGVCNYQGKFYYIKNGTRQTTANGWKTEHNRYYYFGNRDGSAYTKQWLSYGGAYYYFGADATLAFNTWVSYAGKSYYMGSNGKLCISTWTQIDGEYVYFNTEGQMVTNSWVVYRGKYYFMDGYGHPYVNTWHTWNGTDYHFDAYGRCDKVGR